MKNKYLRWALGGLILLLLGCLIYLPIHYYQDNFDPFQFSDKQADWGAFGDYLGGIVNPVLSLLTLLTTGSIAYLLYQYENKRDDLAKQDADINSFKDLYAFFIGQDFRETRLVAWYILKKAIAYPEYGDFVVNENYVSRYTKRKPRAVVYQEFGKILYQGDHPQLRKPKNEGAFLRQEALDRNKVDVLINFYQLLSFKAIPKDHYKICDFYYDTWRPLLYWYAERLEKTYAELEDNRRYNNPPNLREALVKLDQRFFDPMVLEALEGEDIQAHPIVQHMKKKDV